MQFWGKRARVVRPGSGVLSLGVWHNLFPRECVSLKKYYCTGGHVETFILMSITLQPARQCTD